MSCLGVSHSAPQPLLLAIFLGKLQEFAVLAKGSLMEPFRATFCFGGLGLLHKICQFDVFSPSTFQFGPESAVFWQLVFIVCGLRLWLFSSFTGDEVFSLFLSFFLLFRLVSGRKARVKMSLLGHLELAVESIWLKFILLNQNLNHFSEGTSLMLQW